MAKTEARIPETFEDQVAALDVLGGSGSSVSFRFFIPASTIAKKPHWRATVDNVDVSNGGVIFSLSGDGKTPEDAIQDIWGKVISLTPYAPENDEASKWLVLDAFGKQRRHIIWDNFMWKDIPVKSAA